MAQAIELYDAAINTGMAMPSTAAKLYCNHAACYLQQQQYALALVDCLRAKGLDPAYCRVIACGFGDAVCNCMVEPCMRGMSICPR